MDDFRRILWSSVHEWCRASMWHRAVGHRISNFLINFSLFNFSVAWRFPRRTEGYTGGSWWDSFAGMWSAKRQSGADVAMEKGQCEWLPSEKLVQLILLKILSHLCRMELYWISMRRESALATEITCSTWSTTIIIQCHVCESLTVAICW